jgi:hypothetical protein
MLYLPMLGNGFAYDDVAVIQLDTRVHSLSNALMFVVEGYWADTDLALYRPLTTLSFALDWSISDGNPAWFLFVNSLWNAAACALVLLFLGRFTTPAAAAAGALFFAVHPVHVEAVANIVGRAELMAATFLLGSLLIWPCALDTSRRRVAAVGVLYALALATKESAIMLPALLVLLDAARGHLTFRTAREWAGRRGRPLLVLGCIATAYLVVRALVLGGIAPTRVDAVLEVTSGADRLLTGLQAWPVYLQLLIVPVTLLADYGPRTLMPALGLTPEAVVGGVILLCLVMGGIHAWLTGRGMVALVLLWLPLSLLPVSNLIFPIGIVVAERTLYLPSLAVALGVALVADRLSLPSAIRVAGAGVFATVIVLFSVRTLIRIPDWHSTDTIFAALLRDRPDSFRAHWHHARLAAVAGQHDVALNRYVHALELWPYRPRLVIEAVQAAGRARNLTYARDLARYGHERWSTDVDLARLYVAATLDLGDTIVARRIVADALLRIPGDSLLVRMQHAVSDSISQ